jgi:hypothetical protein
MMKLLVVTMLGAFGGSVFALSAHAMQVDGGDAPAATDMRSCEDRRVDCTFDCHAVYDAGEAGQRACLDACAAHAASCTDAR